ncbi:uncharacterized protein EV422DRAFT_528143 [Fimicolochytrium jonesii]|uniref:uncharacterized protein n=1 Tax=Fimicolochytrium jonesii TaxID=1396493 RepID=UPI0022FF2ECC|nr:uncharacterized protein EV422DRAFT_528143 [Fimicolochytrium jonesii]KAI8821431.1 hypothetical protein EV422DRAFT_528143 [Fimicolochytrium jonesii]
MLVHTTPQAGVLHAVALTSAGLFAGAALYVTAVEHPARFALSADIARAAFKQSYPRAARLQAALATIASGASFAVGYLYNSQPHYISAAAFLSIPIYTIGLMLPLNKRLQFGSGTTKEIVTTTNTVAADSSVFADFRKWGLLHLTRVVVSGIGFGALVLATPYAIGSI